MPLYPVYSRTPPSTFCPDALGQDILPLTSAQAACYIAACQPPLDTKVCLETCDEFRDDGQWTSWPAFALRGGGLEFGRGYIGDSHRGLYFSLARGIVATRATHHSRQP